MAPSVASEIARAAALLDGVQDGFYALDQDWRFTYFNRACQEYFGLPREQVIGRRLPEVLSGIPPQRLEVIAAALRGEPRDIEFRSGLSGRLIALKAFPIDGGCGVTFRDATDQRRLEAEVVARAAELQTIYESAPVGLALLDHELRYIRVNAALAAINGLPAEAHVGRLISEVVPSVADQVCRPFQNVVRTGVAVLDLEVTGDTPAQPGLRRTWTENIAPVRHPDGQVRAILVSVLEITARKQAEARAKLLLHELNHRVKNTLATVQSIAAQTMRGRTDLGEFKQAFEARLIAMSSTHDLLTAENWEGAELRELVEREVSPFGEGRVQITGAPVRLNAGATLALGMVFHELATNAVKYGALSSPEGSTSVEWKVSEGKLRLVWKESGGPTVHEPERRGFGSRLIERSAEGDLGGSAILHFAPAGLTCFLNLPLDAVAVTPAGLQPA